MANEWILLIWYLILGQQKTLWLSLAFALVGRIFYQFAVIVHWKVILKGTGSVSNGTMIEEPSLYSNPMTQKGFWFKFYLKELIYIGLAFPGTYVGLFILGYSILAAGQLLRSKTDSTSHSFLRFIGWLLKPLLYWGGVLGTFWFTWSGGSNLIFEFLSLIIAGIVYRIMRKSYPTPITSSKFTEFLVKQPWARMHMAGKIAMISCLIVIPYSIYGLILTDNLQPWRETVYMVEMRDGIKLKTRVYLPFDYNGTPLSVVLTRSPYNIDASGNDYAAFSYVLTHNYALVTQDMRGCFGSEGGPFPIFRSDYADGYDTVEWIMEQSWCNKKIATFGGSALGINQIAYHAQSPAGLQAASIVVGSPEMYEEGFFIGGCFRQNLTETWIPGVMTHTDNVTLKYQAAYEQIALFMQHPTKDSFYESVSLSMNQKYKNVNVRAVHIGGFYDMFAQGTIDTFSMYNQGTDYARGYQILVMGPWNHGIGGSQPDIKYPGASDTSIMSRAENLIFGEYLQGKSVDWANEPRVYYYVMGDPEAPGSTVDFNHWRNASAWPVPSTFEKWYFHPDGTLSPSVPSSAQVVSFLYDPRHPVESIGGTELTLREIGASDQREVENDINGNPRGDILRFTSAKLEAPVEIVGKLDAQLYISSNCTDTDFVVKLMDIFPDGRQMWVADGILKARYWNGYNSANLLNPGQIYQLSINMWSTAYRFVPGHQIRISVTSSLYNKFALNPNTGAAVGNTHIADLTEGNYYIANNSVICGNSGLYSSISFPRTL